MSLYVHLAALNESAQAWEDTSATVRGSRKSLSDVDASLLHTDAVGGGVRGG